MSTHSSLTEIPVSAAPFFQEYNFSSLDVCLHAELIIERILAYGNRAEVRWLIQTYGRAEICKWIEKQGIDRLSWGRFHMWCLVFGLPIPERPQRIWPH